MPVNPPSLLPVLPRNIKPLSQDNDDDPDADGAVTSAPDANASDPSEPSAGDDKTDNQMILRLLEDGEKVIDTALIHEHIVNRYLFMIMMLSCRSATCSAVRAFRVWTLWKDCYFSGKSISTSLTILRC